MCFNHKARISGFSFRVVYILACYFYMNLSENVCSQAIIYVAFAAIFSMDCILRAYSPANMKIQDLLKYELEISKRNLNHDQHLEA